MKRQVWIATMLVLAATVAMAQSAPTLKQRGTQPNNSSAQPPAQALTPPPPQTQAVAGFSTLPPAASGEYQMSADDSSVVQITIDQGRLTGYVSKMDNGVTLTMLFTHTTLSGSLVSFTTTTIHALHYEFKGMIVRGDALSMDQTGFFALTGKLTEYRGNQKFTREVNWPSTPRTP